MRYYLDWRIGPYHHPRHTDPLPKRIIINESTGKYFVWWGRYTLLNSNFNYTQQVVYMITQASSLR